MLSTLQQHADGRGRGLFELVPAVDDPLQAELARLRTENAQLKAPETTVGSLRFRTFRTQRWRLAGLDARMAARLHGAAAGISRGRWRPGAELAGQITRLIDRLEDNPERGTAVERYLLGVVAHEMAWYEDALRLIDSALTKGLEGDVRSRADRLRAICAMKLEA